MKGNPTDLIGEGKRNTNLIHLNPFTPIFFIKSHFRIIIFGRGGGNKRRGEPGGFSSLDMGVIGIYSLFLDELGDFPHEGAKTEFWSEAVLLMEVVEHAVNTVVFHHHHHCGAH